MAVVTLTATKRSSSGNAVGFGGGGVKALVATVETSATDSVGSTFTFGQIPSNARILGVSTLACDDIGGAGAAVKVGLFGSVITNDDDALATSISVASAASSALLANIEFRGKMAWELVSGRTTDPNELLTVKATLITAALDAAGTLNLELLYSLD